MSWTSEDLGLNFQQEKEVIFYTTVYRLALGPTQPPIQQVQLFPWGQSSQGMKLTTHLFLVQRLRMCGAVFPLPRMSPCHGA